MSCRMDRVTTTPPKLVTGWPFAMGMIVRIGARLV